MSRELLTLLDRYTLSLHLAAGTGSRRRRRSFSYGLGFEKGRRAKKRRKGQGRLRDDDLRTTSKSCEACSVEEKGKSLEGD